MELSPQFINDMLINFGGYFIAGILGTLFYFLIIRNRKVKTAQTKFYSDAPVVSSNANLSKQNTKIEFIKLGENKSRLTEQVQNNLSEDRKPFGSRRKNRPEVINIARKMLKSGATFENIKKVLPVSEAELNLIEMNNN